MRHQQRSWLTAISFLFFLLVCSDSSLLGVNASSTFSAGLLATLLSNASSGKHYKRSSIPPRVAAAATDLESFCSGVLRAWHRHGHSAHTHTGRSRLLPQPTNLCPFN